MRPRSVLASIGVVAAAMLAVGAKAAPAGAAARTPLGDEVVETQLLAPTVKRAVRELAAARGASEAARIETVRHLIRAARDSGDPRALGYAEQLLGDLPTSATTLVLQATLEQSRHQFETAHRLLDRALLLDSADVQALLTRASVAQVSGRSHAALSDCRRIEIFDQAIAALCLAQSEALLGLNEQALARTMHVARSADATRRAWALSLAGDIERQNGELSAAIRAYTSALAIGNDLYTRIALADALNADRRPEVALAVLARAPATDAVLLQRWRALRMSARHDEGRGVERELDERIALGSTRADFLHLREAAFFALERGDARSALALARRNWSTQREAADLLLLATAARAANDATAVQEARAWIEKTGLRDRRVEDILRPRNP